MKKILSLILCVFMLLTTINVLAEDTLTIISGTVLDGELDAEISVLLRYEFSEEIKEPALEDVTVLPATVGEVLVDGKVLTIRLAATMAYDTEHTLDLSKVTSVSGKKLSANDSIIKFETKHGKNINILEDDFEGGVLNESLWRAPKNGYNGVVKKEGDNGNYSYKIGPETFDNGSSGGPYSFSGQFVAEFNILIDKDTLTSDYHTFYMTGNNGLSGDSSKKFECLNLLGYDIESEKFGVLFNTNTPGNSTSEPASLLTGKEINEGWNNILVWFNLAAQSLKLYVNGELVKDGDNSDFLFPLHQSSTGNTAECVVKNIRYRSPGTGYGGGADASIYYDNISYRDIVAPELKASTVKNDDTVSVTCPEINLRFKNHPTALQLSLNDTPISERDITKNADGSFTIFPSLAWGVNYTLSGTVFGLYGSQRDVEINFSTSEQPDALIETVGFFDASGERLSEIEPGNITAKVKFWQKTNKSYILLAGLYKEVDGRIKMLSVSSPISFTSEGAIAEKEVSINVPEDCENCFVELIILKDSLLRMPYESSLYSGSQVLK